MSMHSAFSITNILTQYLWTFWRRRIQINSQFGQVKAWWLFGRNAFLKVKGTVLKNDFLLFASECPRSLAQLHLLFTRLISYKAILASAVSFLITEIRLCFSFEMDFVTYLKALFVNIVCHPSTIFIFPTRKEIKLR